MCKKGIQTLFHEYNNCDYGPKIPMNSMIKQSLDQQCTVTKPAISYMASSLSVELLIALLQENKDIIPADTFKCNKNSSEFGLIPHLEILRRFKKYLEHGLQVEI